MSTIGKMTMKHLIDGEEYAEGPIISQKTWDKIATVAADYHIVSSPTFAAAVRTYVPMYDEEFSKILLGAMIRVVESNL